MQIPKISCEIDENEGYVIFLHYYPVKFCRQQKIKLNKPDYILPPEVSKLFTLPNSTINRAIRSRCNGMSHKKTRKFPLYVRGSHNYVPRSQKPVKTEILPLIDNVVNLAREKHDLNYFEQFKKLYYKANLPPKKNLFKHFLDLISN